MHRMRYLGFTLLSVVALFSSAEAKEKKPKPAPKVAQDEIAVVGHIPLTGGPIRRFISTQHYSSFYLYAEHDPGKGVTLIDVTKSAQPAVLADVAYTGGGGSASIVTVAGTAALVTDSPTGADAPSISTQTIRVFDLADPLHPKVAREFAGVTAISRDDRRGLIFLANAEGVWILHQNLATDPEVMKEYERYVMYSH